MMTFFSERCRVVCDLIACYEFPHDVTFLLVLSSPGLDSPTRSFLDRIERHCTFYRFTFMKSKPSNDGEKKPADSKLVVI